MTSNYDRHNRPRDSYRSRVYGVDAKLANPELIPRLAERLETLPEIEEFLDRISSSEWWRHYRIPDGPHPGTRRKRVTSEGYGPVNYPAHFVHSLEVRDGRGRRSPCAHNWGSRGVIKMPKWTRTRHMVLHEVAHTICPELPGHGALWVRILLDLTHEFVGAEEAEALRKLYEEARVPYLDIGYTYERDERRTA